MTSSTQPTKHEPLSLFSKDSLMSFISGGVAGAGTTIYIWLILFRALLTLITSVLPFFIAGFADIVASRTVVSPLERLKIIQCVLRGYSWLLITIYLSFCRQVQSASGGSNEYRGVWQSLVRMWKEEGFKGYMRGNGVNCLRIVPYVSIG